MSRGGATSISSTAARSSSAAWGGCDGNPKRPFRFEPRDQETRLFRVMEHRPDILLVHQGPPGDGRVRPGADIVEKVLGLAALPTAVFCGHEHWESRLVDVGACRVLNAHEAICVLLPA